MNLSRLDGKRISVVVNRERAVQAFQGIGTYHRDAELGSILRIDCDGAGAASIGNPALILQEDLWPGLVITDDVDGTGYRIELDSIQADE